MFRCIVMESRTTDVMCSSTRLFNVFLDPCFISGERAMLCYAMLCYAMLVKGNSGWWVGEVVSE